MTTDGHGVKPRGGYAAIRGWIRILFAEVTQLESEWVVTTTPFDLKARAHQAMLEAGFQPDFPDEVAREVQALNQSAPKNAVPVARDLRSLLWSSIDNDSSRDLDQVEYVDHLPDGTVRLLVGIADVDASVPKGSATDQHAAVESTSVYTGVATFPMLPGELSTDRTSLLDAQDRLSIIIELHICVGNGGAASVAVGNVG